MIKHRELSLFLFLNSKDLLEQSQYLRHLRYLGFTTLSLKLQDEFGLKSLICFGRLLQFFMNFGQIDIIYSSYHSIHQIVHCNFWFFLVMDGESKTKINGN